MQPAEWKTFIAQFAALSRHQRLASATLLRGAGSQNAAVALVESVARQRLHCPACNSSHAPARSCFVTGKGALTKVQLHACHP